MREVKKTSKEEEKSFKIIKAIELINRVNREPEPKYLWKGIPEGSTGLITGVAKTGKTTFAENLAISLSVGKKMFFGHPMDGIPRKVLYINLEEGYRIRSRRNQKQINELNKDEIKLFCNNYISTPIDFPEFLNTDEDWAILKKYIEASEAEIIFIDSLSHMCIGEIERSYVAQQFAQTFRKHVSSLNKTVIVVHHNTKGNDRPMDLNNIAGSRFILQEFEFAIGFENIPTAKGGNYSCMLYNKYIEKDDTTAQLYKMSSSGWIELLGTDNKFNLYKNYKDKDGREDSTNPDLIYDYIVSQASQGSQQTITADLMKTFVTNDTRTMSKDTLHVSLKKLEDADKIAKVKTGIYTLKNENDDEARIL